MNGGRSTSPDDACRWSLRRDLARGASRFAIGVSGGADSIQLLDSMERAAGAAKLLALHVDHGVRPESAEDARRVAEACARRGVTCRILHADRARISKNGRASEARMRAERYRQLAEAVRSADIDVLYLAHHRSDRVEGVILAARRDAGMRGLAGMRRRRPLSFADPAGPTVARPFLDLPRESLRDALARSGAEWIEDASNDDLSYARNFVRHVALPHLRRTLGDSIDDRLLRLARLARVVDARYPSESDRRHRILERLAGGSLSRSLSRVLQRGWDSSAPTVHSVGPDRWLEVGGGKARQIVAPAAAPRPTAVTAHVVRDRARRAHTSIRRLDGVARRAAFEQRGRIWLDADRLVPPLTLRHRRDGDRLRPLGRAREVKLKRLFSRHRVPPPGRDARWILCDRLGPVAAEGLPPSDRAALTAETERILRVRFWPSK